jgi:metal-responsive CopG/Arc/MetJ family transcriptional regulator
VTILKTIQMTIDKTLLQEVDQTIANLQMTRSAFIREALEQALLHYQVRRLEERDAVGYTAVPANGSAISNWGLDYKPDTCKDVRG